MKRASLIIFILTLTAAINIIAQTEKTEKTAPPIVDASPMPLPSPVEAATKAANAPPPLKNLRYDEDFSYLRDESKRRNPLDWLKFIALNVSKSWYFTVGGEIRMRYETYRNDNFGAGTQDANGYFLERFMLHTDFHFGEKLRIFAQVKSGLLENRRGGARPVDADKFDLHQAFADFRVFAGDKKSAFVRVGRHEVEFGSSRFVSVREGANVRQSFDGATFLLKIGKWQFLPWLLKPVTTRRGVFDDRTNKEQTFGGGYAARILPNSNGLLVVFASRLATKNTRYGGRGGREKRDTIGARIAGKTGAFDYNYEAAAQFGKFANEKIRAWAIVTDSGYGFSKVRFKPRLALRFDSTSGDCAPNDGRLQTFNPLFASPIAYSGLVSLISPSNSTAVIPSLELNLTNSVVVKFDAAAFWRTSRRDDLYGSPEARRGGLASRAKFVGNQPSAQIVWRVNRYFTLTGVYSRFFAGRFLRESPPAENVDYLTSYLTFKF